MLGRILMSSALIAAGLSFGGCSDSEEMNDAMNDTMPTYEVSLTNLTAGQPISPSVITLHNADYSMFSVGKSASVELEHLAEGGSNSELYSQAQATSNVDDTEKLSGLLKPGKTLSVTLKGEAEYLSLAGMLVYTNDGFIGLSGYDLSDLEVGEQESLGVITYDSGTEINSETTGTVPDLGGEGFNGARDDTNDVVHAHSGVISKDDGLSSSGLSAIHKFDNPTAKLVIKRIQ